MDSKDIKALIMAKKIAGGSGGDTQKYKDEILALIEGEEDILVDDVCSTIGYQVFKANQNIKKGTFKNVTSVGEQAFYQGKIEFLDFHKVTSIGSGAFNISKIAVVVIRTPQVCEVAANAFSTQTPFSSNKTGGILYVPNSLISAYQADENWSAILAQNAYNQILAIEGSQYE